MQFMSIEAFSNFPRTDMGATEMSICQTSQVSQQIVK